MNNTTKIVLGIVALSLSFGLGYFATPSKIKTKEVTKTVTVKEEAKTRVVYRDRVISKDGTITEKEVEREETNTKVVSDSATSSEKSVVKDAGLTISALAVAPVKDIGGDREYALVVSKRVVGALNLSVMAATDKKIGVGLGWSF